MHTTPADYGTADEAALAASVYRAALEPFLRDLPERGIALEIGTGTGVFLSLLRDLGFEQSVGIEPSLAAIAAANEGIKDCIREGIFTGEEFPADSVSLVCCFQTLEHVPASPRVRRGRISHACSLGGMIALVTHDYTALRINRLLYNRSPIIDIEHLQLFCPTSLRHLVTAAGYDLLGINSIRNVYPLSYWINLLPLHSGIKRVVLGTASATRIGHKHVSLDVGNLLTVAQKPS